MFPIGLMVSGQNQLQFSEGWSSGQWGKENSYVREKKKSKKHIKAK